MYVAGQKEMQQMDQYTIEKLGLPGVVLMENAGAKVVEEILVSTEGEKRRILILAGGGNNGGDGFVIARRLFDQGLDPLLCLLVKADQIKGDARCHYDVYVHRKLPIFHLPDHSIEELKQELCDSDIIVDAMLGTGVKGTVRKPFNEVISAVNEFEGKKMIIAVDIPSGVSSDDGRVAGVAIRASKTVTFVFPKKGFFLNEGPAYVGEWKAVDISVPPSIVDVLGLQLPKLITESQVTSSLPIRPSNGHKGTFGHALVIGGSRPYVGAPIYTAKAVIHSGAGLVTLAVPESIYPMVAMQTPEALFLPLADQNGHLAYEALEEISTKLPSFNCIAIGPGMSRFEGGEQWLRDFFDLLDDQPIVVDADALFLLKGNIDKVHTYNGSVIFTPHPGEMAQLLGVTVKEIEENRIEVAEKFARDHHVYLLLKGHRSIIATPGGEIYLNPYGHDALSKGGSGDVLTGLITSLLAQGATPLDALICGSYLHAKSGENQAKILSHYGVMPMDLIANVKQLLNQIV